MSSLQDLSPFLSPPLRRAIRLVPEGVLARAEEVRVRLGRPLTLSLHDGEWFVDLSGSVHRAPPARPYVVTAEDISTTLQLMTDHSLYAVDEQLRHGFLTLPGGHRVGLAGRAVLAGGEVKRLTDFSGLNVRVARARPGAADTLIRKLKRELATAAAPNVLLVSPPGAGKTTLLRDFARQVSAGARPLGIPARRVVILDERSELASCRFGVPQHDVGPRTDVLDACPKPEGVRMALRSLSPEVLVTDEVGSEDDVDALLEARGAGVSVFASAHARSLAQLSERPATARLVRAGLFDGYVTLSRRDGPGTIESITRGPGPVLRRAGAS